jgi:hypothetical protein
MTRLRRPSARLLSSLLLCALLLSLLAALRSHRASPLSIPAASTTTAPHEPHLAHDQLLCALEHLPNDDGGIPSFRVVLTNMHPSSTVSLLVPGSVFADGALARGRAFDVRESGPLGVRLVEADPTADGDAIATASGEDFVDILPFHAMTKDVRLRLPVPGVLPGRNYTVQARGRWRAVWHARLEDYGSGELKRMGGPTGLIDWSYTSNALEVAVT